MLKKDLHQLLALQKASLFLSFGGQAWQNKPVTLTLPRKKKKWKKYELFPANIDLLSHAVTTEDISVS